MDRSPAAADGGDTKSRPRDLFRDAEFAALASVRFVSGMSFATVIIALALYADLFSASGTVAGLFGAAYGAVRLVLVLPLGRMIDVGNSKRYLLIGLALNVLLFVGLTLVESIEHVIVLRGLQGAGTTVLWITGVSLVGQISPDDNRTFWIGTYNQVRSIASLSGDIVGGALLFEYGFTVTYAVLIALTVLSVGSVTLFVRHDAGDRADPDDVTGFETLVRLLKRRAIVALVVFRFAFSFGKNAVLIFLPIYARTEFGMSAFLIGGILAGGKLAKGLSQGYVGDWADRVGGYEWFILAGTIIYALGTALVPMATPISRAVGGVEVPGFPGEASVLPAFVALFLAYVLIGIADSLRLPTSMALFVEEGEYYDAVAGSLSLRTVSWQIGTIVGPVVVGAVFDVVSFSAGFWLAAGSMIVAGWAFIHLYESEVEPDPTVPTD
jgi:MFS family permease